jgi:hypothetical protein
MEFDKVKGEKEELSGKRAEKIKRKGIHTKG